MKKKAQIPKTKRSFQLLFNAHPKIIFPLLCPEREKEWIPNWTYEMIHSNSGLIEEGCIFKNDEYDTETIWFVAKHDPIQNELFFIHFAKNLLITEFSVMLSAKSDYKTTAIVQYKFTPLSEKGAIYIAKNLSQSSLQKEMSMMENFMNLYLANN